METEDQKLITQIKRMIDNYKNVIENQKILGQAINFVAMAVLNRRVLRIRDPKTLEIIDAKENQEN